MMLNLLNVQYVDLIYLFNVRLLLRYLRIMYLQILYLQLQHLKTNVSINSNTHVLKRSVEHKLYLLNSLPTLKHI